MAVNQGVTSSSGFGGEDVLWNSHRLKTSARLTQARARIRSWRINTSYRYGRLWKRKIKPSVISFLRWWPLWGLVALAVMSYFASINYLAANDKRAFHINLLAGLIVTLVAFAVAWFFIDRQIQNQARRVSGAVRSRVTIVRNYAALRVTSITSAAFNEPRFSSHSDGIEYVKTNYVGLRTLLKQEDAEPQWYRGGDRDPRQVYNMVQEFDGLTSLIDQTIRLFGPGLLEYPELLKAFERFQNQQAVDRKCWDQFWEQYGVREQKRHETLLRELGLGLSTSNLPESPLAPHEALVNLLVLAAVALDIVVAITIILKDWDEMPQEDEARNFRPIWQWRYTKNDYKALWMR